MLHFNEQRRFFGLWEKSVVYDVVCLVKAEAGLDCCFNLSPKNITWVLNRAALLLGGVEELEKEVMNWPFVERPLCEEIKNNLAEMKESVSVGYIYTLIEPFRDYQSVKFDGVEDVEKAKLLFRRCFWGDGRSMAAKTFAMYERIVNEFGRMLDIILLKRGKNLQWYERAVGVQCLADWSRNEREVDVARYLCLDIREAAKMVDEALPRLDAGKTIVGREGVVSGFRGRLLKGGDELLAMLHRLIHGKRGKAVALVLYACMELGYMTRPTKGELLAAFGIVGSGESINKYLRGGVCMFDRKEVEAVKARLSEVVERHEKVDSVPKTATRNG